MASATGASVSDSRILFSADALVRFREGRILVHTTSSNLRAFESDNPMLIGWLCQFCKAVDAESALAALRPPDRVDAQAAVGYLLRSGALIHANEVGRLGESDEELLVRTKQHLRFAARSLYELACDIIGFGAYAEDRLRARTGVGVERRLMALLASIDGLKSELVSMRHSYVESQLAGLAIPKKPAALKLHIGCGQDLLDGWINIDVSPAPLALNVQWGLPFPSASVRYMFVSHLLEHMFFPRDVMPFLTGIRRALAPGATVRFVVPDVEQCIEAYVRNDRSFFESRREIWPWWPANPTRLEDFLGYAGVGAEPLYLFESHKYGYDFETLERVLRDAGFTGISRSGYMSSSHQELRVDDQSAVARAKYGERYYSLFVEASVPC